jgi:hypothetical protein
MVDVLFLGREDLREGFKWVLPSHIETRHFKSATRLEMERCHRVIFRDTLTGLEYNLKS